MASEELTDILPLLATNGHKPLADKLRTVTVEAIDVEVGRRFVLNYRLRPGKRLTPRQEQTLLTVGTQLAKEGGVVT